MIKKPEQFLPVFFRVVVNISGGHKKSRRGTLTKQDRHPIGQTVFEPIVKGDAEITPGNGLAGIAQPDHIIQGNKFTKPARVVQLVPKAMTFIIKHMMIIGKANPA